MTTMDHNLDQNDLFFGTSSSDILPQGYEQLKLLTVTSKRVKWYGIGFTFVMLCLCALVAYTSLHH
jgi:hypothetical protein